MLQAATLAWLVLLTAMLWMPPPANPTWEWEWLDESIHLTLFAGLAGLATWSGGTARTVLLACLVWAIVTEVVQGWLPWPRTPEVGDVVADMIGATLGWAIGSRLRPRWLGLGPAPAAVTTPTR